MEKEKKVSGQLQAPAKKSTSTKKTTGAKVKSREDAPENTNKKENKSNIKKEFVFKLFFINFLLFPCNFRHVCQL